MDDPVCHIDKLPAHLLVQIFDNLSNSSFLHDEILLNQVGLVNRRWNEIAFSPQLWRSFERDFRRPNTFSPEFSSFFHRIAPAIEDLQVGIDTNLFHGALLRFPSLHNVTRLSVNFKSTIKAADADWMVNLCPSVTSASVNCTNLSDEVLQQFAFGWKNLVEMDFDGSRVTRVGLIEFVSVANRLQSIDISDIDNITDSDINVITRVLGNSLKSLKFGLEQENRSHLAIQSIGRNCPQLEEIYIQRATNFRNLSDLTNLRRLTISLIHSLDRPAEYEGFDDCLSRRPFAYLRYVRICAGRHLSDSLFNWIANSCPVVETLHLGSCVVDNVGTDVGLNELVDRCRSLTNLVYIRCPHVTGRSSIGTREKLPRLRALNSRQCQNGNF